MNEFMSNADSMAEQISYMIWGEVVTTTKAFGDVNIKVDANICMVFVSVRLRWWAQSQLMEKLRNFWLRRAEIKARNFLPTGWRLLIFYEHRRDHSNDKTSKRPSD